MTYSVVFAERTFLVGRQLRALVAVLDRSCFPIFCWVFFCFLPQPCLLVLNSFDARSTRPGWLPPQRQRKLPAGVGCIPLTHPSLSRPPALTPPLALSLPPFTLSYYIVDNAGQRPYLGLAFPGLHLEEGRNWTRIVTQLLKLQLHHGAESRTCAMQGNMRRQPGICGDSRRYRLTNACRSSAGSPDLILPVDIVAVVFLLMSAAP